MPNYLQNGVSITAIAAVGPEMYELYFDNEGEHCFEKRQMTLYFLVVSNTHDN